MNACTCQSALYSNSADGDLDLKNAPNILASNTAKKGMWPKVETFR